MVVQFYSPLPMAVEIERQKDDGTFTWETWQQFADDCQVYFNTVDNGLLGTPTSVNCLKITPRYVHSGRSRGGSEGFRNLGDLATVC